MTPLELDHAPRARSDPALPDTSPILMIRRLRLLQPERPLTLDEGISIAELQATRLLHEVGVTGAPVPQEVITGLSRIAVRFDNHLPVSGLVHWHRDTWLIHLNPRDQPYQQRLTIGHEFKHIVDHTDDQIQRSTYAELEGWTSERIEERLADYFARCLFAPKMLMVRYFAHGVQTPAALAHAFQLPENVMRLRLHELGLVDAQPARGRHRHRWKVQTM